MTLADITLLGKKILVGILVALIPALILFWGLRLTQKLLTKAPATTSSIQPSN
ncbi:hypothetical protein [Spirosoma validum]|uniref:Uncharacterized protein n=1 Tax=Spirosoma validum TaxID=2771355 RepID=A0A927GCD2_9BACT|nr:hypothetical protein [Spirosoma validum]MBD2752544.1 hypothetical protein [Spirosoma validum]